MTALRRPPGPGLRRFAHRFALRSIALPLAGAGLAAVVGLTAGCGNDEPAVAGAAERNGVRVEVRFDGDLTGDGAVLVTFTPQQQGFHLYSTDLPARGVDGIGRPTRVELTGGLSATSAATADRSPVRLAIAGVSRPVPVYPDGAVTLRLPVRRSAGEGAAVAVVGYAACSTQTCLPPVSGLRIPLTLS